MKMLPVIASAAVTAGVSLGFAAAVDRMTAMPQAATTTPRPFVAERVQPRSLEPAPLAIAPQMTVVPDITPAPVAETPLPAPVETLADLSADLSPSTAVFLQPSARDLVPVEHSPITRRPDFNNLPIIGAYR